MRTIAVVNQKGGCGKTTTAINFSACLASNNKKVLLIDLDPQAHASIGLDVKVEELEKSIYDVFTPSKRKYIEDVIITLEENFDLIPSQLILSAVEQELAGKVGRESILARSIQEMERSYHYVIVDCPPNLGLLTFNALRACREALIPIEMSVFSLQGVARLLEIIEVLKVEYGHEMRTKALATICNPRTLFAHEVLKNIEQHFGKDVYKTIIHATVKLKEAAGYGLPIHKYDKNGRGTEDYMALAGEVIIEEKQKELATERIAMRLCPQQVGDGVLLRYYDPSAREVKIAGDFSNWQPVDDIMIQQKGDKVWKGTIHLTPGKYEYKFIVDGKWKIDPNNPEVTNNDLGVGNSLLIVQEH
jgi:chromosome partitioning protein